MTNRSANAVLEAAAKSLIWDLFATAGYCRTRSYVNVDKFERELLTAVRQWKATRSNLNPQRRKHGNTER
jgi:hypothetical protein